MRLLDIIASTVGLVLLVPVFIVVALLIKLDSRGHIFYQTERVGRNRQLFRLYKFRTMTSDADRSGPGITVANDTRITRPGRFLRRYGIDELPQLINVLKGEMSLVGPRPEDPRYVEHYTQQQRAVLTVRPGITSQASLHYRNEESLLSGRDWEQLYVTQILPHKLQIELDYLTHRTLWSDLLVITRTIVTLLQQDTRDKVKTNLPDRS